jgi:hypothetical protein
VSFAVGFAAGHLLLQGNVSDSEVGSFFFLPFTLTEGPLTRLSMNAKVVTNTLIINSRLREVRDDTIS